MGWQFNPAPGWPAPPPGWRPPEGWRPDPSWPAAPAGWVFWVEDAVPAPATTPLPAPAPAPAPATTPLPAPAPSPAPATTPLPAPSPVPEHRSWAERHADKKATREHEKELAGWQAAQDRLDEVARIARSLAAGTGIVQVPMVLQKGEVPVLATPASLVEPRRAPGHYAGGYSGVSVRIAKGVRYNVGGTRGHYVPGDEVQTPVDTGRAVVTTRRIVFTGDKATREWAFAKLVGLDSTADGRGVMVHVSNRQKTSGLMTSGDGERFQALLALALAAFEDGADQVADDAERAAADHRAQRP